MILLLWQRIVDMPGGFRRRDDEGASLVEYALLLALVAIATIVALQFVGGATANSLNSSGGSLFAP